MVVHGSPPVTGPPFSRHRPAPTPRHARNHTIHTTRRAARHHRAHTRKNRGESAPTLPPPDRGGWRGGARHARAPGEFPVPARATHPRIVRGSHRPSVWRRGIPLRRLPRPPGTAPCPTPSPPHPPAAPRRPIRPPPRSPHARTSIMATQLFVVPRSMPTMASDATAAVRLNARDAAAVRDAAEAAEVSRPSMVSGGRLRVWCVCLARNAALGRPFTDQTPPHTHPTPSSDTTQRSIHPRTHPCPRRRPPRH